MTKFLSVNKNSGLWGEIIITFYKNIQNFTRKIMLVHILRNAIFRRVHKICGENTHSCVSENAQICSSFSYFSKIFAKILQHSQRSGEKFVQSAAPLIFYEI